MPCCTLPPGLMRSLSPPLPAAKQEIADEKEQATAYFSEQYRKMFEENLGDYEENFDKYI